MTEREMFLALLDLSDPAARAAFLDGACAGDAALRGRVESLLRSHEGAGSFLGEPAVAPLPPGADPTQGVDGEAIPFDPAGMGALNFLAPSRRPDSLGRLGHYEVLEVLGRGGFGIVFRAFDEVLHRVVAVKVLTPQLALTSPARKRFLREARASARVRHENVVQVYAVEESPLPHLVMEYVPGETLQQRLDRAGPLDLPEAVQVGAQIAEGLAAAHATGLVHRDVKPANVLLEPGSAPRVKITDFGLARAADDASLTQSGLVAGTPMFMAPEQARGERVDHRADLFSLGSVLYTVCTGRPPFRANGTLAVLRRVAEDTPRPIPEVIPEVPRWLCDVIDRLHAKDPEGRFGSAREVADLLARGTRESPVVPACAGGPRAPLVRRYHLWGWAVAVLLVLVGLGVSEATGVSNVGGTVVRLLLPEGTLVVEVVDPAVGVTIDGEDVVITGTGAKEIRLKPGQYRVRASKAGRTVREELVTVSRRGRQVVRVGLEAKPAPVEAVVAADPEWERELARQSAEGQVNAVVERLKRLNPGFDGAVTPTVEKGEVVGLRLSAAEVTNLAPVRALKHLRSLVCAGAEGNGKLADLGPLRGMQLTKLVCDNTRVSDLTPLKGMPLNELAVQHTRVSDLAPLAGLPLLHLNCSHTGVSDLAPLKGMKLVTVYLDTTGVSDLSPLRGMPLKIVNCRSRGVDLKRQRDVLDSLTSLEEVNSEPVANLR